MIIWPIIQCYIILTNVVIRYNMIVNKFLILQNKRRGEEGYFVLYCMNNNQEKY